MTKSVEGFLQVLAFFALTKVRGIESEVYYDYFRNYYIYSISISMCSTHDSRQCVDRIYRSNNLRGTYCTGVQTD